jgi:hypothetical protein
MDLAKGKVSTTQLTLTKSLRAEYKAATPPAHKMLADRIKARDPGNAPASGDRISFLYILPKAGQAASNLQGDRIETPTWIKEKRLGIDFKYYMEHQLMNPLVQLFALIVEQLPGCLGAKGSMSDRELAASDYLFKDALAACDKTSKTRTLAHMFGSSVTTTAITAQRPIAERTRSKIETKVKVQSTLTMQRLLLKAMENKKPDTKTVDI